MIKKKSADRAIISQKLNSINIEIPAIKHWVVILFGTFWLAFWLKGGTVAISYLFNFNIPLFFKPFILLWLIIWVVGCFYVGYWVLWQLLGREIIKINGGILILERSIKGICSLDMYMYEVNSIKNIDLNHEHEADIRADNNPESIFGNNGSKIKFDYGMETVKFAKEVDETEAKMIIEEMKKNSNFKEENFV